VKSRIAELLSLVPVPVCAVNFGPVILENFERRGRIPCLGHTVVSGYQDKRDSRLFQHVECGQYCNICMRPRLDPVKKISCVNDCIGFFADDDLHRFEKIVVDLFFTKIHPAFRVDSVKSGKPEVCISNMDDLHIFILQFISVCNRLLFSFQPGLSLNRRRGA